jgi:hypothetical protein
MPQYKRLLEPAIDWTRFVSSDAKMVKLDRGRTFFSQCHSCRQVLGVGRTTCLAVSICPSNVCQGCNTFCAKCFIDRNDVCTIKNVASY